MLPFATGRDSNRDHCTHVLSNCNLASDSLEVVTSTLMMELPSSGLAGSEEREDKRL